MTDQNDIERYCRNCVSRDFVNGRGLVCKRTGAIPAFVGECESYQKDEELEKMAPTPKPEDYSGYVHKRDFIFFGVDKLCDGRFLLYRRSGGQRI